VKAYGGVDVWIHIFLTLALVRGQRSASRPYRFTAGEIPLPPLDWPQSPPGRCVEEKKILLLPGFEPHPSNLQPVAVPAHVGR
jgi:hypothetical protein